MSQVLSSLIWGISILLEPVWESKQVIGMWDLSQSRFIPI